MTENEQLEMIGIINRIKAEAHKEFAERLISKIAVAMKHIERNPYDSKDETKGTICGLAHAIGMIKEMVGEEK